MDGLVVLERGAENIFLQNWFEITFFLVSCCAEKLYQGCNHKALSIKLINLAMCLIQACTVFF